MSGALLTPRTPKPCCSHSTDLLAGYQKKLPNAEMLRGEIKAGLSKLLLVLKLGTWTYQGECMNGSAIQYKESLRFSVILQLYIYIFLISREFTSSSPGVFKMCSRGEGNTCSENHPGLSPCKRLNQPGCLSMGHS